MQLNKLNIHNVKDLFRNLHSAETINGLTPTPSGGTILWKTGSFQENIKKMITS